jgi:hypothetical protein
MNVVYSNIQRHLSKTSLFAILTAMIRSECVFVAKIHLVYAPCDLQRQRGAPADFFRECRCSDKAYLVSPLHPAYKPEANLDRVV